MKELLLALPAGRDTRGRDYGLIPAHMAYRVGDGPKLLGIQLPQGLRGGLMLVDCAGFDGAGDPVGCCRQILAECRRRSAHDGENPALEVGVVSILVLVVESLEGGVLKKIVCVIAV